MLYGHAAYPIVRFVVSVSLVLANLYYDEDCIYNAYVLNL